jgi:hypothetical protein
MKTFQSKYRLGDNVTLTIDNEKIRWCVVRSVKFEEDIIRYDIVTNSGMRIYDVIETAIEGTGKNTDTTEIE